MKKVDYEKLVKSFKRGKDILGNVYYESEEYGFRIYKDINPYKSRSKVIKYRYRIFKLYNGKYENTFEEASTKEWAINNIHSKLELEIY